MSHNSQAAILVKNHWNIRRHLKILIFIDASLVS